MKLFRNNSVNIYNMNHLSSVQCHALLQRFPKIELSYETIPHKKVSPKYNVCIAIPMGVKCYAWFTFYGDEDVCFIMEINKERKINKVSYIYISDDSAFATMRLSLGTILYGSFINNHFIIEDAFLFKGIPIQGLYYGEKLGFLENMFYNSSTTSFIKNEISFHLPSIWGLDFKEDYDCVYDIPAKYTDKYPIHHIQYRCLSDIAPYLNVFPLTPFRVNAKSNRSNPFISAHSSEAEGGRLNENLCKKGFGSSNTSSNSNTNINNNVAFQELYVPYRADFSKPQYRQPAIFKMTADIQFDVYHMFAYGRNKSCVYYNVAYIQNYKLSVFMNNIFRTIKENANLDAIEESDDDEDFENIEYDKYVDLKKHVFMECRFNMKFKKWVPIRVVQPAQKVVHISML